MFLYLPYLPGDNIPAGYKLIKEKQRTFNVDNGLRLVKKTYENLRKCGKCSDLKKLFRVHERGKTDSILHNFTLLVIAVGTVEWCRVWWSLAYPEGFK